MTDADTTPPDAEVEQQRPVTSVISAESAQRLVLVLLALWTMLSGLALTFFQDASGATIGGGLHGGPGHAAQRLLGVHLLVLAPIYGLIAWEPRRFRALLWVPYAAQGGVIATTLYDIIRGYRPFVDAALPLFVAIVFFVLLLYVTFADRRPEGLLPKTEELPAEPPGHAQPVDPPPQPAETA